jgi:hypothetical protein
MFYTIEFIKDGYDQTDPVVVAGTDERYGTQEEARTRAAILFISAKATHGATGYRLRENGIRVITTVVLGRA